MTRTVRSTASITADARIIASFQEVARHLETTHDGDIDHPRATTLATLVGNYVKNYPDDFDRKGENSYVFVGGESHD